MTIIHASGGGGNPMTFREVLPAGVADEGQTAWAEGAGL